MLRYVFSSSQSIPLLLRTSLYLSFIFPKSDTKHRILFFPRIAVPTPLLLHLLLISYYLNFKVTIDRIANKTYNQKSGNNFTFMISLFLIMMVQGDIKDSSASPKRFLVYLK
jgi:hypothetical protein